MVKSHLIKLKTTLKFNYLYYYFLFIFLLIISFNFKIFFVLTIIFYINFKKRINKKVLITLVIPIIISFIYINIKTNNKDINDNFLVINIKESSYNNQITVKNKFNKYIFYSNEDFIIGEIINLEGNIKPFKKYNNKNSFDLNKYYLSNGIKGELLIENINKLNKVNIFYSFSNIIKNKTLKTFLGFNMLDEFNNELINDLNIYYLISLSGIHLSFLILIIKKIMFHLNTKTKNQQKVVLITYTVFLIISNYKTILIRIFVYQLLLFIKKRNNLDITNYSLMNSSFYLTILINPYLVINKSYLISYLLVSAIHLFSELIDSTSFIIKTIKLNILSNIILLPFFSKVNILSIILSPLYYILLVNILFPISLINNFTNSYLLFKIEDLIFKIINETNKFNFNINLYSYNYIIIFLYLFLVLLFIILKKNKLFILTLIIVTLSIPRYYKNFNKGLYILDTGQGSSSVYIGDKIVVIDAYLNVGNFLQSIGIKEIDYLILTHSHFDHINEANSLINDFNVKKIITSKYDNDYNLNKESIKVSSNYYILEKDFNIYFYGPLRDYNDSNNNSLVFSFSFNNTKVLFTGDIEKEAELEISNYYKNSLKHDYLIVAHHGSNTSSTLEFLNYVKPKYAIISLSNENSYGFPSFYVLERLKKLGIKTYLTSNNGMIKISNKDLVKTYI